jgi:hypothetical protein
MKIVNDISDFSINSILNSDQHTSDWNNEKYLSNDIGRSDRGLSAQFYPLTMVNRIKPNDLFSFSNEVITNNSFNTYIFNKDIPSFNIDISIGEDINTKRKQFYDKLFDSIINDEFEYGKNSKSEYLLQAMLKENSHLTKEVLEQICKENRSKINIICGLLRIISHFEYSELKPQCISIVTSLISHKNEEVVECVIRCCENWENDEALNVLRKIKCRSDWMNNYLQEVINNISREISK